MRTKRYVPYTYMLPGLIMVLCFVYIPVMMNIGYSFFRLSSYSQSASFVGLDNYRRFFTDDTFPIMLRNNGLYCLISLIVQVGFEPLQGVLRRFQIGQGQQNGKLITADARDDIFYAE